MYVATETIAKHTHHLAGPAVSSSLLLLRAAPLHRASSAAACCHCCAAQRAPSTPDLVLCRSAGARSAL
eukprot:7984-Heterococcus_DN1.PRE.4